MQTHNFIRISTTSTFLHLERTDEQNVEGEPFFKHRTHTIATHQCEQSRTKLTTQYYISENYNLNYIKSTYHNVIRHFPHANILQFISFVCFSKNPSPHCSFHMNIVSENTHFTIYFFCFHFFSIILEMCCATEPMSNTKTPLNFTMDKMISGNAQRIYTSSQ